MRRVLVSRSPALFFLCCALPLLIPARARGDEPLTVRVTPWGPTPEAIAAARSAMTRDPAVQRYLRGARFRILSFRVVVGFHKSNPPVAPDAYRSEIIDYTHNRGLLAEGSFSGGSVRASVVPWQPLPSDEEFAAAVDLLRQDPVLGPPLRRGELAPYPPMPPLEEGGAGSNIERTLHVGLMPVQNGTLQNQIVGVNMIRGTIVRYPGGAPATSRADAGSCGLPNQGGDGSGLGDTSYHVTINQGPTVLWDFTVTRPADSSGLRGSGVELDDVYYLGKKVLARAHIPILNVRYVGDACGPYRDWFTEENLFMASGDESGHQGFMICNARPQTILDDGSDNGNFGGVALYIKGGSVYLVSECAAGWYRYVMEWQLDADGTIHPKMGFGATANSCVCNVHTHHAYWRFDFDIDTPENNAVSRETPQGVTRISTEAKFWRTPSGPLAGATWLIQNTATGDSYRLTPGFEDGTADDFGKGDTWILQYHQDASGNPLEVDDGINCTTCQQAYAHLDNFVNGEPVDGQDVVVWYAAHFVHNYNDTNPGVDHIIGPVLKPVSW